MHFPPTTWGVAAGALATVFDAGSFYAARLALGAAEAGAYPGMMVILTRWFPFDDYPVAYGWVSIGSAMGCIVVTPCKRLTPA